MKNITIKPSQFLQDYIDYYWIFESDNYRDIKPQLIYPIGSVELMFHYETPFKSGLIGGSQESQPFSLICFQKLHSNEVVPAGRIGMISVYFKPYGASVFFNLPFDELADSKVDLCSAFGDKQKQLLDKIASAKNINKKVEIIESFLYSNLLKSKLYEIEVLKRSVEFINSNFGKVSVDMIADYSFITHRQLERLFIKRIGLTPKQYIKIKRINFAIGLMEARKKANMTQIALDSGFYDQSHFINNFKEIVGIAPKKFESLINGDINCCSD